MRVREGRTRFVGAVVALAMTGLLAACSGGGVQDAGGEQAGGEQEQSEAAGGSGFPDGPVRIIVGHGVGGSTDSIVRPIQKPLQEALGTEVVIENVEGGGGMVAAQQVYSADPDGHELYAFVTPAYILQELFGDQAPPFREFEFIHRLTAGDSNGLATAPDSDIQTLDDLVAVSEERGELLMSATSGLSNSTLAWALLIEHLDINFVHVPYESGSEALQAVLDGTTDTTIAALASLRDAYADGQVEIITHFGEEEFEGLEDVSRFGERFPGATFGTQVGLIAPPGTPDDVVETLRQAVAQASESDAYVDTVSAIGQVDPLGGGEWAAEMEEQYSSTEELRPAIETILELQQQ